MQAFSRLMDIISSAKAAAQSRYGKLYRKVSAPPLMEPQTPGMGISIGVPPEEAIPTLAASTSRALFALPGLTWLKP